MSRASVAWLRTVTPRSGCSRIAQVSIGQRVAEARTESGLTQAQLASAVGLDRSALAKIETDARRVSAVELVAIARELHRRMDWFVEPGPPAIASYRASKSGGGTQAMDIALDRVVRDVEFVAEEYRELLCATPEIRSVPGSATEAEALAEEARSLLGLTVDDPAYDLGNRAYAIGLVAFSLRLEDGADAGTVLLPRGGVTIVNGSLQVGRRRLALAHELAHYLVADEYTTDWRINADDADRTESLFDRFARALLLPEADLRRRWAAWTEVGGEQPRDAAVRAGSHYRVDMATLARRLTELGFVEDMQANMIRGVHTRRADIIEKNLLVHDELAPIWMARAYEQAVLALFRRESISADRALHLLQGALDREDLPDLPPVSEDEIWAFTS
jgi:transcriptional regulator with XRE-family HTH domain/Zn-dependent peptidase ImmA (M78 family)